MIEIQKGPQESSAPRRPVNAAEAAYRAARARSRGEEERYRSQAMGRSVSGVARAERPARAMSAAALALGALLAALAFLVLARATFNALTYPDERPSGVSESMEPAASAISVDPDAPSESTLDVYGSTFGVAVDDEGASVFFRMPAGGDPSDATSLITVDGKPAGMAYTGDTFIAVVNTDGGYEVWACSDSQGALPTCISEGPERVSAVKFEQAALVLEGDEGALASLSLDPDGS